ncbi:MAG: TauD/TfdA family dioxygenase [Erythrobacter sp.]|nr:TauD/TfdA family dioxygenase [Erythrobacter sp.]
MAVDLKIEPLAPECGVTIHDVQLAEAEGEVLDAIRRAVFEHGVAVFRGQALSPEQHIDLAKRWGGIDINNYFPLTDAHPEIAVVRKAAGQETNIGGAWHTDHSYDQVPAMGSILVARTLPPKGGDTLFAHMGAAYDALDEDTKRAIEGLEAFHTADHVYKEGGIYAQTDMGGELRGQDLTTGATHPVVVRHPRTGRKLLYVNPSFTVTIVGRSRADSLPLLKKLFAEARNPAHHARVVWEPGAVAIWDNRTTWHNALNDYHGHAREMHRITLTGEKLAASAERSLADGLAFVDQPFVRV